MDLRKIKKLIEMLQESDLNEIEVKEGEESVRINRKKGDTEIPQPIVAPQVHSKQRNSSSLRKSNGCVKDIRQGAVF